MTVTVRIFVSVSRLRVMSVAWSEVGTFPSLPRRTASPSFDA
ncbi:MAG: hypothetical protein ACI381_06645 [Candidatus Methanomethylophilaceae archaeon]